MVQVGDKKHPWRSGMTLEQLIQDINDPYQYVLVRLNGKMVSLPNFKQTTIPKNSKIQLIPMIAGG